MKYVWPAIWNFITVGVVWGILSQLDYNSELQTVAALIMLVYVNLLYQSILAARINIATSLATLEYIAIIIKHQGDETTHDEINFDTKKMADQIASKNAEFYTNLVGMVVIWISCIWTIFGNL